MKLSCKEVCFVVSESLDRKLSLRERFRLKLHFLLCKACQRMARQMPLLRSASLRYRAFEKESAHAVAPTLSADTRERILARLRLAQQDSDVHD